MLLSRTRKQIKNMESFYKEAGLDRQIENIYDKNSNEQALSKKHRVHLKKKLKLTNESKLEVKTNSDKLQSESSEQIPKQLVLQASIPILLVKSSTQSTLPIDKMINKISLLQVAESKFVNGCYGHTTVIFKRPIIQGQYYLQFKMMKSNLNETKAKIKSPPSIRIGICEPEYPKNSPLGQDLSLCYKGKSGNFVHNSQQFQGGQSFKQGDVIGLGISFSPSYKYLDRTQQWEDSQIIITKNGKQMKRCSKINQTFYCPAFSLYNYASLEVRCDQNMFQFPLEGYKSYGSIFNQRLNYETLKNKPQFAFLKHTQQN